LEIERRTALTLYAEIQGLGFEGDYSRVTEFIRRWRVNGGAAVVKAFLPLQFEPGEAYRYRPNSIYITNILRGSIVGNVSKGEVLWERKAQEALCL
jgi:hypothetical protein